MITIFDHNDTMLQLWKATNKQCDFELLLSTKGDFSEHVCMQLSLQQLQQINNWIKGNIK